MNKVELVGRLSRDVSRASEKVVRLTIAVQRKFKNDEGKYDADFIGCIAFNMTGEFIERNFKKGDPIAIVGHIQTGSYVKDDETRYTTDVVIEEAQFVGRKANERED